jgi:hypothetical protein
MGFAVIGIDYKSKFLFTEGTVNAARYITNLREVRLMDELDEKYGVLEWIFQQDGAPCHTRQEVAGCIEENCDLLSDWPPNSPDLSPIEMLWGILKSVVAKTSPTTVGELKQVLVEAWASVPQLTVDKVCRSFGD